jgi:hypothetical protein
MTGHRNRRLLLAAAVTTAAIVVAVQPARGHTHPTPIERAAPGVVVVETRAVVEVSLIEHRTTADEAGVHIGVHNSTWNPVLGRASGFTVDPTGGIVTTGSAVAADLERAKVFAANQAFRRAYGTKLPTDPFAQQRVGPADDRTQQRLQGCYPPHKINDAGGCIVKARLDLVVYPNVTSQQRYGAVRAEVLSSTDGVAVLRVRGANSWPTVGVARSVANTYALGVLGFDGIPGPGNPAVSIDQHLATPGAAVLKTTDLKPVEAEASQKLAAMFARNPSFAGGPVIDDKGAAIGLLPRAPSSAQAAPDLVGLDELRAVLEKARVTPRNGSVDQFFETAMHHYKNKEYAASLTGLQESVKLFPGHALATANLAVAKAEVAAGRGRPSATRTATAAAATGGADLPWALIGGAAALIVALGAAGVLLTLRRSRRRATGPEPAAAAAGPRPPRAPVPATVGSPAGGVAAASAASRPGPATPRTGARGTRPPSQAVPRPASPGPGSQAAPRPASPAPPGARQNAAGPGQAARQAQPGAPVGAGQQARSAPSQASALRQRPDQKPVTGGQPAGSVAAAPGEQPSALSGQVRYCTTCGGRLAPQHQFCGWCGAPVE